MSVQSTLIGLALLGGVVVMIALGIAAIHAWEEKHDTTNGA